MVANIAVKNAVMEQSAIMFRCIANSAGKNLCYHDGSMTRARENFVAKNVSTKTSTPKSH
jgi:hypothetical protein